MCGKRIEGVRELLELVERAEPDRCKEMSRSVRDIFGFRPWLKKTPTAGMPLGLTVVGERVKRHCFRTSSSQDAL